MRLAQATVFAVLMSTSASAQTVLDAAGLVDLVQKRPEVVLIDSRGQSEFERGRLPGAVRVLDNELVSPYSLSLHVPTQQTPIIFYCDDRSCPRSERAAALAKEWGYRDLYIYPGGIDEWRRLRLPLVTR